MPGKTTYHYGLVDLRRVVLREQFTGNGADTTFQLTGTVGNATFAAGDWAASQVLISLPAYATKTTGAKLYDSNLPLVRHQITIASISASGLVTLDYPPQAENFYIYYFFQMEGEDLQNYYREDIVTSMEAEVGIVLGSAVDVDTAGFTLNLSALDDTVQKALDTLDDHRHDGMYIMPDSLRSDGTNINLGCQDGGLVGLAGAWNNTAGFDVTAPRVSLVRETPLNTWTTRPSLMTTLDTLRITSNPSTNYSTVLPQMYVSIATGVNCTRSFITQDFKAFRNMDQAGTDDSGTLATFTGIVMSYGHYNVNTSADPQTTTLRGIVMTPFLRTGDIGTLQDLRIAAVSYLAAALPTITTAHYPFRQEQGDNVTGSAANISRNYINARTGFKTEDPQGVVEIEDGGTAYGQLLKITQDDVNVKGIIIGNDTYSTTDANGLQLWVDNSGLGYINNVGGTLNLNSVSGLAVTVPTLIMTNLTDGYIPYHVNDSTGLVDSVIKQLNNNIGLGVFTPNVNLEIQEVAADSPTRLYIIPNGSAPSGLAAGLKMFSTDFKDDTTNYADFGLWAGTGTDTHHVNSKHNGTVPAKDIAITLDDTVVLAQFDVTHKWFGIRTSAPVANLEIEDDATTAAHLVKITQDDANTIALRIGNDTYSTNDLLGFGAYLNNSGTVVLVNDGAGDFYIRSKGTANASDLYLQIEDKLYFDDYNGGVPATRMTFNLQTGNLGIGMAPTAGLLQVGDSTNYSEFESNGVLYFAGTAEVWNDVWLTAAADRTSGTSYLTFLGNTREFVFSVNDDVDMPAIEMPHDWKEQSTISIHVHWATRGTNAGDTGVKWQVEYTMANRDGVFPATTTISAEDTVPGGTAEFTSRYLLIGTVAMTGFTVGTHIKINVKRIAAAGSAPSSSPYFLQVGMHYQKDTVGSRNITTK